MVEQLLHYFCCFECNSLFAIGRVKGCSKHVSSVVAAAKSCNLTPCRFHPLLLTRKHTRFEAAPVAYETTIPTTEVRALFEVLHRVTFNTLPIGPWYGGMQNVWREGSVPENALSRKFLDPSKRAFVLLCRGFLYRKKTEH